MHGLTIACDLCDTRLPPVPGRIGIAAELEQRARDAGWNIHREWVPAPGGGRRLADSYDLCPPCASAVAFDELVAAMR